MLKTKHLGYQTFNDGWGTSFGILNRRLTAPKQVYIHFQEASVGERRFWDAQISGITVVRAVRRQTAGRNRGCCRSGAPRSNTGRRNK